MHIAVGFRHGGGLPLGLNATVVGEGTEHESHNGNGCLPDHRTGTGRPLRGIREGALPF
ncbi:hypothetical protein GCM10023083_27830 [Streptomyces phyllanthi]